MLIHNILEKSAEKYPDRSAVWYKNTWKSYAELNTNANKLSNYLIDLGVKPGERVAILLENSFDFIIAYFAVLKAGAVTVALNTDIKSSALEYALNHSGARVVITNSRCSHHFKDGKCVADTLEAIIVNKRDLSSICQQNNRYQWKSLDEIYDQGSDVQPDILRLDIDLASIVYTSGSTGNPKGVMLSHLNIVSNTQSIIQYLNLTHEDRIMVILPFYYIYGLSLLTTHFMVGGSLVLDNMFIYPENVLKTMGHTNVTGFAGVPSTYFVLLNKSRIREYRFPALRYVTQAGGHMATSVQKEVTDVFAPAKLYVMYGATEAAPRLSYVEPDILSNKWGSIGKAIPNVELYVADEEGCRLPVGEVGEIVARGSNIMMGYWNDPIGTEAVLRNGLYFTGDLGTMDEEGYIFIVGRSKDMIKVRGYRVSAKEIEDALFDIPEVHEASVIGVADEAYGEAVKAFVVTHNGAQLEEDHITHALKDKLQPFKFPKYYEFIDSLPKNESGKVLKSQLA